jgi:hypothetical protein
VSIFTLNLLVFFSLKEIIFEGLYVRNFDALIKKEYRKNSDKKELINRQFN